MFVFRYFSKWFQKEVCWLWCQKTLFLNIKAGRTSDAFSYKFCSCVHVYDHFQREMVVIIIHKLLYFTILYFACVYYRIKNIKIVSDFAIYACQPSQAYMFVPFTLRGSCQKSNTFNYVCNRNKPTSLRHAMKTLAIKHDLSLLKSQRTWPLI